MSQTSPLDTMTHPPTSSRLMPRCASVGACAFVFARPPLRPARRSTAPPWARRRPRRRPRKQLHKTYRSFVWLHAVIQNAGCCAIGRPGVVCGCLRLGLRCARAAALPRALVRARLGCWVGCPCRWLWCSYPRRARPRRAQRSHSAARPSALRARWRAGARSRPALGARRENSAACGRREPARAPR